MVDSAQAAVREVAGARLPPLPHVLVQLLDVCQRPNASFQDMAQLIASDAVISARLLTVANSAYYRRVQPAQTIEKALSLLGVEQLKTIAITASVQQMCLGLGADHADYLKRFWAQSLRCALNARALAHLTGYKATEEVYLLGLLHRMGELALAMNHPGDYPKLLLDPPDLFESSGLGDTGHQLQREQHRYGTNYCEVGRRLAETWGLPNLSVDALGFQQSPLLEVMDAHPLTKILYLASRLSDSSLNTTKGLEVSIGVSEAAERLFSISGALAQEISYRISGEVTRLASSLGIQLGDCEHKDFLAQQQALQFQMQRRLVGQEAQSMLQKIQESSKEGVNATLEESEISNVVTVMFGYRSTLLLKYNQDDSTLVYSVGCDDNGSSIIIPMATSPSLVALAASKQQIQYSAMNSGHVMSVVDRQLLGICGSSSLICAPVINGSMLVGVLVSGSLQVGKPDKITLALYSDFCRYIAHILCLGANRETIRAKGDTEWQKRVQVAVHEIGNPLSIIRNYLESLAASASSEHESQYKVLREEIERVSDILMRLQDIENDIHDQENAHSVNREVGDLVSVLQQSLCKPYGIDCSTELSAKLDDTALPRNSLRQILTNLIRNSVEAMPGGGEIRISTERVVHSQKGETVEITVADSGPGLPVQRGTNVFEAGVSTKDGNHSGLGLSITRSLVEELGGGITCHSSERGTRFTIAIPILVSD